MLTSPLHNIIKIKVDGSFFKTKTKKVDGSSFNNHGLSNFGGIRVVAWFLGFY